MFAHKFAVIAEGVREKERHHRRAMDPDPAQLWVVGRLVSSAGRLGIFAEHVTAPRAAYSAHAEGIASNECAVITGLE